MKRYLKLVSVSVIAVLVLFAIFPFNPGAQPDENTVVRVTQPNNLQEWVLAHALLLYKNLLPQKALASSLPDYIVSGYANDEIQAALDSKTNNLLVVLDSKNYTINGLITISGDFKGIEGYGANITLANGVNSTMLKFTRPSIGQFVRGFVLDGNKANQSVLNHISGTFGGSGYADDLSISDMGFFNAGDYAVNIESPYNVTIESSIFNGSSDGHIRLHGGEGSVVRNNNFETLPTYQSIAIDQRGNLVDGNAFRNNNGTATATYILLFSDASGPNGVKATRIVNNYFLGTYPTHNERGVTMTTGVYTSNSTSNIIGFNSFRNLQYGVLADGTSTTFSNLIVSDNGFENVASPISGLSYTVNQLHRNQGFTTENSGTFSITANLWGVSVSHGLSTNATSVQITLTSNATAQAYILTPITTTAFSVNLTVLQGSAITGYWRAVVGAGN